MPVGRIILKAICQSNKLSKLKSDGARLLYTWLIPNVDVNGCFSGDAQVINGQIFTRLNKSIKTIESYLEDLEINSLIFRYDLNGDKFLTVPDFKKRQPSLNPNKEGKTTIPLPTPELLQSKAGFTPPLSKDKLSKDKLSKDKLREEKGNKELLSFLFLVNKWNEKLEPKIELLSKGRKEKLRVRLNERMFIDSYEKILEIIKTTPFLQGDNDRGWTADFDWLITNDTNYLKVLEGKYKNKSKGGLL